MKYRLNKKILIGIFFTCVVIVLFAYRQHNKKKGFAQKSNTKPVDNLREGIIHFSGDMDMKTSKEVHRGEEDDNENNLVDFDKNNGNVGDNENSHGDNNIIKDTDRPLISEEKNEIEDTSEYLKNDREDGRQTVNDFKLN